MLSSPPHANTNEKGMGVLRLTCDANHTTQIEGDLLIEVKRTIAWLDEHRTCVSPEQTALPIVETTPKREPRNHWSDK